MSIILASASPRRKELLEQIGCKFSVVTSNVDEENCREIPPAELAMALAAEKAQAVAAVSAADDLVIGADTIVVLGDRIFGKPKDKADARMMLKSLAGRQHKVITGIALAYKGGISTDHAVTSVKIRKLTSSQIDNYLATDEPMDKAGAYAIQGIGALLVERIDGCYANVVGLPLVTLDLLLNTVAGVGLI